MMKEFIEVPPDGHLLDVLRRSCGRNDYSVHVLWGTYLVHIALRHGKMEDTLAS